jgi:hypothetical protein
VKLEYARFEIIKNVSPSISDAELREALSPDYDEVDISKALGIVADCGRGRESDHPCYTISTIYRKRENLLSL